MVSMFQWLNWALVRGTPTCSTTHSMLISVGTEWMSWGLGCPFQNCNYAKQNGSVNSLRVDVQWDLLLLYIQRANERILMIGRRYHSVVRYKITIKTRYVWTKLSRIKCNAIGKGVQWTTDVTLKPNNIADIWEVNTYLKREHIYGSPHPTWCYSWKLFA